MGLMDEEKGHMHDLAVQIQALQGDIEAGKQTFGRLFTSWQVSSHPGSANAMMHLMLSLCWPLTDSLSGLLLTWCVTASVEPGGCSPVPALGALCIV